ncbi:MAG: hypothetical protein AAF349_23580, partial [Cyanobacteria bacterium P01_A01_bin.68]
GQSRRTRRLPAAAQHCPSPAQARVSAAASRSVVSSDALQDDLISFSPQVSLVDLPAGAAEYFESLADDIHLFQNAERLGYRITGCSRDTRKKGHVVNLCNFRYAFKSLFQLYKSFWL